jgi:hypothetical protein
MKKLTTAKECFNAAMEAMDLVKGIQCALMRGDIMTCVAPTVVLDTAEARNSLDQLAITLEKICTERGEADL